MEYGYLSKNLPEDDYRYSWIWEICKKEQVRLYSKDHSGVISKVYLTNLFPTLDQESIFVNVDSEVLSDFFSFLKNEDQIYNLENFLTVSKILSISPLRLGKIMKKLYFDIFVSKYDRDYKLQEMKLFCKICKDVFPQIFPSFSMEKLLKKSQEKMAEYTVKTKN